MKQLVVKWREKKRDMYAAVMDLEKVYEKVCRKKLWRVLYECLFEK